MTGKTTSNQKKKLIYVISFLSFVFIGSLIALFVISNLSKGALVASIYQDGRLLYEIPLDLVTEPYTIEIYGDQANGPFNQIEVRPGSIGMIEANCPDKLCVHMGFQDSAMVPITCLPNKVVIQLRIENNSDNKLDGISH